MKTDWKVMRIFLAMWLLMLGAPACFSDIIIRDVTLIDGTGSAPRPHMNVVISGKRIAAVTPSREPQPATNAHVIAGTGKFLIPGLWDMHVHLSKAGENTLPLFIANGVTSVRDMGGDLELLTKWRQEIETGKRIGPRIKMAGPMLETSEKIEQMRRDAGVEPFERFRIGIGGPDQVEPIVDQLARKGVDFLKIRSVASVETYRAIGGAARKHGLTLVGHAVESPEEILRVGQRSIEHGFYPPLEGRSAEQRLNLFRHFSSNGIAMTPTFVVGEALLVPYTQMKAIAEDQNGRLEQKRKYLSGYMIQDWMEQVEEQKEPWPGLRDFLKARSRDVREMFQAGVRIVPGTDTAVVLIWPGFTLHDELRIFVEQLGMTPMQAIISATRSPAEFFGIQDTTGTVEPGKIADLVLLERNPTENITNTMTIAGVVQGGKLFERSEIEKMLADVAAQAQRR
jgi:imidazolonepropionase-like amidohydrolase